MFASDNFKEINAPTSKHSRASSFRQYLEQYISLLSFGLISIPPGYIEPGIGSSKGKYAISKIYLMLIAQVLAGEERPKEDYRCFGWSPFGYNKLTLTNINGQMIMSDELCKRVMGDEERV